jgi:hypothetical protein
MTELEAVATARTRRWPNRSIRRYPTAHGKHSGLQRDLR